MTQARDPVAPSPLARWSLACFASAAVLGPAVFFAFAFGTTARDSAAASAIGALGWSLVAGVVALFVLGSLFAIVATRGVLPARRGVLLAVVLPLAGVASIVASTGFMLLVLPVAGLAVLIWGAGSLVLLAAATPRGGRESDPSGRLLLHRAALAGAFSAVNLLLIALGVLHLTVWNPLARVPGLTLDEIYAGMAAAGEGTYAGGFIVSWAIIWAVAALVHPLLCVLPGVGRLLTPRRIVVLGLILIGGTCFTTWFAGFSMGMSLADTFMTSGGDAAVSGPLIMVFGQLSLVAAVLLSIAPRRAGAQEPIAARE